MVAPASKSSMQRACAMALLAGGETTLLNPGRSNDDLSAIGIIQKLGAQVDTKEDGSLLITSPNAAVPMPGKTLDCGESGLGIRMFTPIAALSPDEMIITGSGSLLNRPMHFFDGIFPQLGVSIQSKNGRLPLKIKGPLTPANISIDGSLSSQFLTGMLMAFAKAATKPVTITVNNLKSKPYIDLTLQVMKEFGFQVTNNNYERFVFSGADAAPGHLPCTPRRYMVEGDWSSAAFLLVAGAIGGQVSITGLDVFSAQADKAILQALTDCGAHLSIEEKQVTINAPLGKGGKAFHFNATHCPDLFPPLVALASYCAGTSVIEGVSRLLHKESNRALTLQTEFKKSGIAISMQDDLMMINGGDGVRGNRVRSHHDHRIAMACAVAALQATGETIIEDAEAVDKSYPGFFDDLKMLQADVSLTK